MNFRRRVVQTDDELRLERCQRKLAVLMEALRKIADDGFENSRDPRTLIARAAIAKAEGRNA